MPPNDTITVGSTVRLRSTEGVVFLAYIKPWDLAPRATVDARTIYEDTPLARALLGHRVGDVVPIEVHPSLPVREVTILNVEMPIDRAS